MFERFTKEARRTVLDAVAAATEFGADKAGPQHLLFSVAGQRDSAAARVLADHGVTQESLRGAVADATRKAGLTEDEISALRSVGIDAEEVFRRIEEAFGPQALQEAAPAAPRRRRGRLGGPFDQQSRKVLELSLREAIALHHRHIGAEHILLALLRAGVPGPMGGALAARGVAYDDVKRRVSSGVGEAA